MFAEIVKFFTGIHYAIFMIVNGVLLDVAAKWIQSYKFEHDFLKASLVNVGQFLVLLVYLVCYGTRKRRGTITNKDLEAESTCTTCSWKKLAFALPTMLNVLATTLMIVGTSKTSSSTPDVMKPFSIVLTGLSATVFLRKDLRPFNFIGIGIVYLGSTLVGAAQLLHENKPMTTRTDFRIGFLLIIASIVLTTAQVTFEQKFLTSYDLPGAFGTGLEGLFGVPATAILLTVFYYWTNELLFNSYGGKIEDVEMAWNKISEHPGIVGVFVLNVVLQLAYNVFSAIVTKEYGVTTRILSEALRSVLWWPIAMVFYGEPFFYMKLIGCGLVLAGILIFNDFWIRPFFRRNVLPSLAPGKMTTRFWTFFFSQTPPAQPPVPQTSETEQLLAAVNS